MRIGADDMEQNAYKALWVGLPDQPAVLLPSIKQFLTTNLIDFLFSVIFVGFFLAYMFSINSRGTSE